MPYSLTFPAGTTTYFFDGRFDALEEIIQGRKAVFITDSNVFELYPDCFRGRNVIVFPAGESFKTVATLETITEQLLGFQADRQTLLVGVGGGVITDVTGFVASIFMRGISFGFVPTTLLGMVDAAVGGKNGVNFGLYKNILGTITQPEFILFDEAFLASLPEHEMANGFAEVIKYACVFDATLFSQLLDADVRYYLQNKEELRAIIKRCVDWKNKTVLEDEQEHSTRKLLNFGHTIGHAIENLYSLPHGFAISIGMMVACRISERLTGFPGEMTIALRRLLQQYGLPVWHPFDTVAVMTIMLGDKKRKGETMDFIVLERLGEGIVQNIPVYIIQEALASFSDAGNH